MMDCPYFWWICFTIGFALAAAALPTDGSYDFKNYHLYNGFAAFHDRRALDIAPAQLQTGYFHGLDAVYYLLFSSLNRHPTLINLLLSIPYSVAATMLFLIARLFARHAFVWPNLVSAAAAVFGLTGAATFPTLATTQSELVPGLAILIALARWLVLEDERRNTVSSALVTGGLASVSVGLKLTEAPLFVGMAVAIALRFATGKRSALLEAFAFGLGGLMVFAALDGAWLWGNAKAYGNPIFPYMNNLFHSDLIALGSWTDGRFIPKTALMATFYPAYWAFHRSTAVSELPMRDPRILLGCASALVVVLAFAGRWLRERTAPSIGGFDFARALFGDRVPCLLRAVGEGLVHLSLCRDPREFERRSDARRPADGVWSAREAAHALGPVCGGRSSGRRERRTIRGGTARNAVRRRSRFNYRRSSRTRWFSSSILNLTPTSYPRCRFRRARSASITISFIPELRAGSGA